MKTSTALIIILVVGIILFSAFQISQNTDLQKNFGQALQGGLLSSSTTCVKGTATSTLGVKYENYRIYSDTGIDDLWARIIIKDSKGQTLVTHVVNLGDSYYSDATGITIRVVSVNALSDGTIVGVDLYVGTSCDISTTITHTRKIPCTSDSDCPAGKICTNYACPTCPAGAPCAPCIKGYCMDV
jgi:hypothetical protein